MKPVLQAMLLSVALVCIARASESLSPSDVVVATVCLNHFRQADLSMLELISQKDLPTTGRPDVVIATLTDTNMLDFLNDPTLDGAAEHTGQSLSRKLKDNLRQRNIQPVSVEAVAKGSPHFSTVPEEKFSWWFADDFPTARAYVVLWLPAYEDDNSSAFFTFLFGPRHHPTQAFYKLKKVHGVWQIDWHKFNYYL